MKLQLAFILFFDNFNHATLLVFHIFGHFLNFLLVLERERERERERQREDKLIDR